ncbi:RNA polymerase sigma factor SigY [Alicyclobacillus sp. SO9]|uniref:RNA polymerase sigma factor SigY n=1 Tax=Alicyclobacillus sp. SO9 TaxID=2665646 RepID=UPI0018E7C111|nr:RNA polymerase sigma factor SigY [Alicyclobacillus sp. SO9]QQE81295.1 RNA polymerase sigma factor SigY [Alicyclobacillus sp. SO9]
MDELLQAAAAQQGDEEALALLLQRNYLFVFKYLLKVTLERSRAEELTQETMVRAIEKIHLYDPSKSKFSSWLMTIATRLFFDERRRRRREKEFIAADELSRSLRWQIETSPDEWPALVDVLSGLSLDTRTAVVLKHFYGYNYKEISKMCKVPTGTVKSRVHNGLIALRKEWLANEPKAQSED